MPNIAYLHGTYMVTLLVDGEDHEGNMASIDLTAATVCMGW